MIHVLVIAAILWLGGGLRVAQAEGLDAAAIQWGLIWTGFYDGMVDGDLGKKSRAGIAGWQRARGWTPTGLLDPAQARRLMAEAEATAFHYQWTPYQNSAVGYWISYPARTFPYARDLDLGGRIFYNADRSFLLSVTVTDPFSEEEFRYFYDQYGRTTPSLVIEYRSFRERFFVVTGRDQATSFYTRIDWRRGGLVGYTLSWPTDQTAAMASVVAAVANSFGVAEQISPQFAAGSAAAVPSPALPVPAQSVPPPPAPPPPAPPPPAPPPALTIQFSLPSRTQPLAPKEVFRLAKDAVWIVVAGRTEPTGRFDQSTIAQGSAVAVADHLLLTNCHTVLDRDVIWVTRDFDPQTRIAATPVRSRSGDPVDDRCVLRIAERLTALVPVRDFASLEVGERVYAIGAPAGFALTLTDGIVSGKRSLKGINYVQTTAPISQGSSGGGLFDERGNLIGITTLFISDAQNLNFAIAADSYAW